MRPTLIVVMQASQRAAITLLADANQRRSEGYGETADLLSAASLAASTIASELADAVAMETGPSLLFKGCGAPALPEQGSY